MRPRGGGYKKSTRLYPFRQVKPNQCHKCLGFGHYARDCTRQAVTNAQPMEIGMTHVDEVNEVQYRDVGQGTKNSSC